MNIYYFTVIMNNGFSDSYRVYAPNQIAAIKILRVLVKICDDGEMVDFVLESVF